MSYGRAPAFNPKLWSTHTEYWEFRPRRLINSHARC
jgi:hypothetical protein